MKTSESIAEISKALLEANRELKNPPATKDNPFYHSKYTPLDSLIDHIKPVLCKHGLLVLQSPELKEGFLNLVTRILHESGEWIETETVVPIGIDAQKTGAAITYARRYGVSAVLNLASETDDDGNATVDLDKQKKNFSGKWPTFDEIKEKLSNMNIAEMKVYWTELFVAHKWSEKQTDALKKIFNVAQKNVNQDSANQDSFNDLPGLE